MAIYLSNRSLSALSADIAVRFEYCRLYQLQSHADMTQNNIKRKVMTYIYKIHRVPQHQFLEGEEVDDLNRYFSVFFIFIGLFSL